MRNDIRYFYLVAVLAMTLSGCKDDKTPTKVPTAVRLGAATQPFGEDGTRYSVSLSPCRQADLVFKSAGIVDEIREVRGADGRMRAVTMGDPVNAGERLAQVRTQDYSQKVVQAKAVLAQANANVASAKASQALAAVSLERSSNLLHQASLTQQDYDKALQQRDSANAALEQAEAGAASAQAELAQANLALSDAAIVAPFSSVIMSRKVELGDFGGSSGPAFTVADIGCLKANFTVPDIALARVRKGQQFSLTLPTAEQPVSSVVTAISASADSQSRLYTVELTIPNKQGTFKPGMIGSLALEPNSSTPHLVVPLAALVRGGRGNSGFAVFVPQNEGDKTRVRSVPITIGRSLGTGVEVLSGINSNQQIVLVGAQTLHDNDEIRVIE